MAKLYMVFYVGAHIVGSAGPLPYDEAECASRRATLMEETRANCVLELRQITPCARFRYECEWLDARPLVEEPRP